MIFRIKINLSKTREALSHETQDNSSVMEVFDIFMTDLLRIRHEEHHVSEGEIFQILHAAEFAAERHRQQTRRNKENTPYIIHPLQVALHLLKTGHIHDADILMAALLHDIIEDTNTSLEELESLFGYRVQHLVQELTDDKSLPKAERKQLQIQNASRKSEEAALIVLADKLSNLGDLLDNPPSGWDIERISNYFLWAQEVIRHLPQINPFLLKAVEEVIDAYWRRRAEQEYGF